MKSGWRWYGADDAVPLKEIRQAGVADVVAALYRRKAGEVWPVEDIVVRPDHGRHMEIDRVRKCCSGYDYGGRLVGLAELRGLAFSIAHSACQGLHPQISLR